MVNQHGEGGDVQHTIDHIELLIVTSDGRRLRFVGNGELVEVDNIEPVRFLMLVKVHDAPIVDPISGEEIGQLHLGSAVEVYANVRRLHAGEPHRVIANGERKGYLISEQAIERVLPDTKPTPTEDDWTEAPG